MEKNRILILSPSLDDTPRTEAFQLLYCTHPSTVLTRPKLDADRDQCATTSTKLPPN